MRGEREEVQGTRFRLGAGRVGQARPGEQGMTRHKGLQPARLRADPGPIHPTVGDRIRPHDQHVPRVGRDDQLVLCWWESDGEWVRSAPAPRFCASLPICVGEVVRRVEWTGGWRRGRAGWTTDGDSGRCAAGREMTPRSLPNLGPCQNGRSLDSRVAQVLDQHWREPSRHDWRQLGRAGEHHRRDDQLGRVRRPGRREGDEGHHAVWG